MEKESRQQRIVGCSICGYFETINHDLLLAKLHAYGFDNAALKLMKNYLTNMRQRTKINTSFGSWRAVDYGVPQGSVLGPL